MKEQPNSAHKKILEHLKQYDAIDYTTLANLTRMSESGVRGRVSELRQMGYKIISKYDETRGGYYMSLEDNSRPLTRPITQADKYAQRLKTTDDYNEIANILDKIKVKQVKKIKIPKTKDKKHSLLLLSDLHFGELIKDTDTNQVIFNTKLAAQRLEQLAKQIIRKLKESKIDTLNIGMLGDIVDGDMIFKNHTFRIEKAAIEQVQDAVTEITKMVKSITQHKIKVNIFMVRGNHGITNYKNLEEDNWDNICYKMLEIVFADNKDVNIVHYQSSEGKFRIGERSIVITHGDNFGDQIKTAAGLRNFRGLCSKHELQEGDLVLIGHLHTFGVEYDQGKALIRNGGLPDTSNYAMALNLYSSPEQTLLILNDTNPYPEIYPIELTKR